MMELAKTVLRGSGFPLAKNSKEVRGKKIISGGRGREGSGTERKRRWRKKKGRIRCWRRWKSIEGHNLKGGM